jgi:hypothetical protein
VQLASSTDHGAKWSTRAIDEATSHHATDFPWLSARPDGGLDAAWFTSDGLRVARFASPVGDRALAADVAGKFGGSTDFPSVATLPDGRAVTVWLDGQGGVLTAVTR